jgi:glyoxylase-like metal-dependent hydrolase (beta-lactamase superfamily II)
MTRFDDLAYLEPLADGIWLANSPTKGRFPHCHGFLLVGDRSVLVDAGIGAQRIREIDQRRRIDVLIISHSHPDHMLAWHVLSDRQLYLPVQTPESVGDLLLLGRRFVADRQGADYWTWVAKRRLGIHPLRQPDYRFGDGFIMQIGSMQLKAIHAPGHLDDHYCFLETTSGTLLSTDIDFTGFGPWYGNPEGDIARFRESVAALRRLPFNRICSSHKQPIARADAHQAFDRYLDAFDRQRDLVFNLCKPSADMESMVRRSPFYRNRMPDGTLQRIFETQMIRKNLDRLAQENRIINENGRYRPV